MKSERRGEKWDAAEVDHLLSEVRGTASLNEIAAVHQRSVSAILLRVELLALKQQEFDQREKTFWWMRSELRKGRDGVLDWAIDRADQADGTWSPPAPVRERHQAADSGSQLSAATATQIPAESASRRREVLMLWSSITDRSVVELDDAPELSVLGQYDDDVLTTSGRHLLRTHGSLVLADWVLECDWPDVERLRITADQIRAESDEVHSVGAELLAAGLRKIRYERNYDIMLRRLGLCGDSTVLKAIGEVYDLSRERIRQIAKKAVTTVMVHEPASVFRAWDHVHGVLCAALRQAGTQTLDPGLMLSFVQLAVPDAPQDVAVGVIASLCGNRKNERDELVLLVEETCQERERQHKEILLVEKKLGRVNAKVRHLVDQADWPAHPVVLACPDDLRPQRKVDSEGRGRSGTWRSDKLGREVDYESNAELRMIQLLDSSDTVVSYCEQPLMIRYELLLRSHDYYPDLVVDLSDGRRMVIEIKASMDEFAKYENVVKFDAAREYCHSRGWGFLATARGRTPADLDRWHVDSGFEHALSELLDAGTLDWRALRQLMVEHNVSRAGFAAAVRRNGWHWYSEMPVRIARDALACDARWASLTPTL